MKSSGEPRPTHRRRSKSAAAVRHPRATHYSALRHPFSPQPLFSKDEVANIHETALRMLADLGMKFLLPEARALFKGAGALVDEETQIVRIGRDIVESALKTAPRSFRLRAANPARDILYEPGALVFSAGSGCPNVSDRVRGRRPGSLRDYHETLKLQQSFDVIHMHGPSAEPQDIPLALRHYAQMRG